jgi:protein arginine kinase activator
MFQHRHCFNCHKETAEVRITKIEGSEVTDIYLCQKCAGDYSKYQKPPDVIFSLSDIFENILKGEKAKSLKSEHKLVCNECGLNYETFKKTGLLGCSACYNSFSSFLIPLLRRIHGSTEHIGKSSSKIDFKTESTLKIEELKKELDNAVKKEDFEKAAILRDKIKSIEDNINQK